MQYLLTESELNELHKKVEAFDDFPSRKDLQEFCTKIADTLPIPSFVAPKPWGCIITAHKNDGGEWYCDNCPAQKACPYPHKEWSK